MFSVAGNLQRIKSALPPQVRLVAVSKTHSAEAILEALAAGQYIFGENKVQELVAKYESLPKEIEWHMIGHLQSNKVKFIAPFVSLIHSVDSLKLLEEIDRQGAKLRRPIHCLLEIRLSTEDTKFGMNRTEVDALLDSFSYRHMGYVRLCGLMGMAAYTDDIQQIKNEFRSLHQMFKELKSRYFSDKEYFKELSMGMSGDYTTAIEEGSTLVRIGTSIFGHR